MIPEQKKVDAANHGATIQRRVVAFTVLKKSGEPEHFLRQRVEELKRLLGNIGYVLETYIVQYRDIPDPQYYMGKGKIQEIKGLVAERDGPLLLVDGFLSPKQQYALENFFRKPVWDRTEVILRIFEAHAFTREAKLQIALARHRHEIPYLKGLGHQMSRLGGGIGTRGPGETEYQRHRRKIDRNIRSIEKKLKNIQMQREHKRQRRIQSNLPLVTLVGYTNSGKTTLLGAFAGKDVAPGSNKLFATLDTAIRRVFLPGGTLCLVSDTVGFIRNLPPELISSFRTTLEEIAFSEMLLLVLDGMSATFQDEYRVVRETLGEVGAGKIPRICLINKIDGLSPSLREKYRVFLQREGEEVYSISGMRGRGSSPCWKAWSSFAQEERKCHEKHDRIRTNRSPDPLGKAGNCHQQRES